MYNWSVDEEQFKQADPEGYEIWRLEQLINWGLDGEKLDRNKLRLFWNRLSLDEPTKNYLSFLLWPPHTTS